MPEPSPTGTVLIDTDVLIDYLKSVPQAITFLEGLPEPVFVSAVSVAELYGGVRDPERPALDSFVSTLEILPVDHEIAVRGGLFRRDYGRSHGVQLSDALIAATADAHGATLVTLNRKHFPMFGNVLVPYQKP